MYIAEQARGYYATLFFIGKRLPSLPDVDSQQITANYDIYRWKRQHQLVNSVWSRGHEEYQLQVKSSKETNRCSTCIVKPGHLIFFE